MAPGDAADPDVVEIQVPALSAYVPTVRLTAASLGAMCELSVDDLDDLRLLVDEACSLVLPLAAAGSSLSIRFELTHWCLAVETKVAAGDTAVIDRSGYTWTVLQALASSIQASAADGTVSVLLSRRRTDPLD